MNPQTSKIGESAGCFWNQNMTNQIPNRKNHGVALSVYPEYGSNKHGDDQRAIDAANPSLDIYIGVKYNVKYRSN